MWPLLFKKSFWILNTNGNTEWGKQKTANLDVIGLITQLSAFPPYEAKQNKKELKGKKPDS